jgi:hypothetical protein
MELWPWLAPGAHFTVDMGAPFRCRRFGFGRVLGWLAAARQIRFSISAASS